jgi:hypothetical protein
MICRRARCRQGLIPLRLGTLRIFGRGANGSAGDSAYNGATALATSRRNDGAQYGTGDRAYCYA